MKRLRTWATWCLLRLMYPLHSAGAFAVVVQFIKSEQLKSIHHTRPKEPEPVRGKKAPCICGAKHFRASEIATACGCSSRNINRRAAQEGWPHEIFAIVGGRTRHYKPIDLPADLRNAMHKKYCNGEA